MKVKIKKLDPRAEIPRYAKEGDAGLDLTAISHEYNKNMLGLLDEDVYGTGLAIEIPEGYVGLIFPRSSLSKKEQYLSNHVGVIDSCYRGEIKFKFKTHGNTIYEVGDRIGQLIIIPYPKIEFEEVEELSETERGAGGFGSSGN